MALSDSEIRVIIYSNMISRTEPRGEKMTRADDLMLIELEKLEKLSTNYEYEMKYLSKRIRKDMWEVGVNSDKLGHFLRTITKIFSMMNEIIGEDCFFSLDTVIEYINILMKYSIFFKPKLNREYFDNLISDVQLQSAAHIIEQQWKDVHESEDEYKSFLDIFDDIFTKCIDLYKDKFFHELSEKDILCRVVPGKGHDIDRFIPWPSLTNNRWNPPGKQYLYLSFEEKERAYSADLSVNEYICLEECKAEKGKEYSFCHFKALKKGNILDLSYNDISLSQIKGTVDRYVHSSAQGMVNELLKNPDAQIKYQDKKKLKKDVKALMKKNPIDKKILEESYAKQYLKMICSCIYKKVDETDETKREEAYKSFHVLSEYLEKKGVTGIIYPCTRTKKIAGKNLVLFNVNDAEPIKESIRAYKYL